MLSVILLGLGDLPSILKSSPHDLYLLAGALFKQYIVICKRNSNIWGIELCVTDSPTPAATLAKQYPKEGQQSESLGEKLPTPTLVFLKAPQMIQYAVRMENQWLKLS